MEIKDKSGIRCVIDGDNLQIWRKGKRGCEYQPLASCYPSTVEETKFGKCMLKISVPPNKPAILTMDISKRQELQDFADYISKKGKELCNGSAIKSYHMPEPVVIQQNEEAEKDLNAETIKIEVQDKKGGFFAKIKCPKCNSLNFSPIDTKKKFSLGKAVVGNTVGGLVFGPAGAIVGAATGIKGKTGKTKFVCHNCGKVWEQKV